MKGIDLSNNEPKADLAAVKTAGYDFLYHKASEGLTFSDTRYAERRIQARSVGLAFGAYHFGRPEKSASRQALHFALVAAPHKGDLVPMLDIEVMDDRSTSEVRNWVVTFLYAFSLIPPFHRCGVYGSPSFLADLQLPAKVGDRPLWIADWEVEKPSLPLPWNRAMLWQYTDKAIVPGAGVCDANELLAISDPLTDWRLKR